MTRKKDKEGDQPGDTDVRGGCVRVEGGSAQIPLGCVAVKTLTLEKAGDGHNVGGRGRHCLRLFEGILITQLKGGGAQIRISSQSRRYYKIPQGQ